MPVACRSSILALLLSSLSSLAALPWTSSALGGEPAGSSDADPLAAARRDVIRLDLAAARAALDETIAAADDPVAAEARLLRAVVRLEADDRAGALEDLRAILDGAPEDPAAGRARLLAVEVLADLGRHGEASDLADEVVARLRSDTRRREIARLYVDAAAELLGADDRPTGTPPPFGAVQELLLKALELDAKGPDAAGAAADLLLCGERLGRPPRERIARARELLAEHPEHPRASEVRERLGAAHREAGDVLEARDVWLDLARRTSDPGRAAEFLAQVADLFLRSGLEDGADLAGATGALDRLEALEAGSTADGRAGEDTAVRRRGADLRLDLVRALAKEPALRETAKARLEILALDPTVGGEAQLLAAELAAEDGAPDDALDRLLRIVTERPLDEVSRGALRRYGEIARAAFEKAVAEGTAAEGEVRRAWFERARGLAARFVERFPTDAVVPWIEWTLARLLKLEGRVDEAIARARAVAQRFPLAAEAHEARLDVARWTGERGDFAAGLALLREIESGPQGAAARRLRQEWEAPSLHLDPPRPFRPGETPVVNLHARNFDEVEVLLHHVDLEAVFLAAGTLGSLTALDVSLIRPDASFVVPLEAAPYVPVERRIELPPLEGPGAAVVSVRAGGREARTAVIVSDLDALAVATARTTEVIAGGSPPRARVASDGRLLPEERSAPEREADARREVLAVRDGACALVPIETGALEEAPAPNARAWLVLDRERARPGEALRLFGVLRVADEGGGGPQRRLEWRDRRTGLLLRTTPLEATSSGTFSDALRIDPSFVHATAIDVALVEATTARDGERVVAAASVDVAAFEPPAVDAQWTLPPLPLLCGETPRLRATLVDESGVPLVRERVEVAIGDEEFRPAVTDLGGTVHLDVPERWTFVPGRVTARVRARAIDLARVLPVVSATPTVTGRGALEQAVPVLAERPTPLEFAVADARGAAVSTELRLRILAQDAMDGWRVVLDRALRSDDAGRVSIPFTPESGGRHHVQVEVVGARGLPVRHEWSLAVAGDGDGQPLSLVPATSSPSRGAELRLVIHSELEDRPATLVLHDVELRFVLPVRLTKGASEWSVPIPRDARAPFTIECLTDGGEGEVRAVAVVEPTSAIPVRVEGSSGVGLAGESLDVRVHVGTDGTGAGPGEALLVLVQEDDAGAVAGRIGEFEAALHPPTSGRHVRVGSSAAFVAPSVALETDGRIAAALADLERAAQAPGATVMIESLALERILGDGDVPGQEQSENEVLGLGGGAGGKFGGRYGGGRGAGARRSSDTSGEEALRWREAPAVFRRVPLSAEGRATETIDLPEEPGRWTLLVAAFVGDRIGVGTLALEVAAPVRARLDLPAFVREGDAPRASATLTEREGAARNVEVVLAVDDSEVARRVLALRAHETVAAAFSLPTLPPGVHRVTLTVDGSSTQKEVRVEVAAPPRAPETVSSAVEPASGGAVVVPEGGRRLRTVRLAASPLAFAAERALAPAEHDPRDLEAAAWALWIAADAAAAARASGVVDDASLARLDDAARARLRAVIGLLPPAKDDERGAPLARTALERAVAAGLDVPAAVRDPLAARVAAILSEATDPDRRAWLLFLAGRGAGAEFALLNRLFRERESLRPSGLALLALAWADAGREAERETTLRLLADRAREGSVTGPDGAEPRLSPGELAAVVRAAAATMGADAALRADLQSLTDEVAFGAGAPLVHAVRTLSATSSAAGSVRVATADGRTLAERRFEGPLDLVEVSVPDDAGEAGVRVEAQDGGTFVLGTVWSAPSDAAAPAGPPAHVSVDREVRRMIAVREGRRRSIGDLVVRGSRGGDLHLKTARVTAGRPVEQRLVVDFGAAAPPGEHWIDVPLPAWGTIDVSTVRGAESAVVEGSWLRLRVRRPASATRRAAVRYVVLPGAPGLYRAPSLYAGTSRHGERRAVASGATAVTVVDFGEEPDEGVPPSPDERHVLGLEAAERGDHPAARAWLLPLARMELEPVPFVEVTRALLLASVGVADAADTVRLFEVMKERDPAFVVPFDVMRGIGDAYRRLSEPERARQIALAIVDATFLEEAQVVGRLESVGLARRAFAAMQRLLAEYGDTPTAAELRFAFGIHAYDQAKATDAAFAGDARRLDRGTLFRLAVQVLEQRLAMAPRARDRDEVLLTLVNALVDAGRFAEGRDLAAAASASLPEENRLRASLRFVEAHACLALEELDRALALATSLADDRFPEGTALLDELRAMGRHLAAQVHHARGDLALARQAYDAVRDRFPDAARALAWLERKGLRIPAVTRTRIGEPLRLEVEHQGEARALDVKAFPIDLRELFFRHRGLDRLEEVRLEGIAPAHAETVALGNGATEVEVHLDGPGAWLLLVRAGDLHARGLLLRSDLRLEADPAGEQVRVHAIRAGDGRPWAGALVTFTGERFSTRRTDLRGICELPASEAPAAAIAEAEGQWAFLPITLPPRPSKAAGPEDRLPGSEDHLKRSQQVLEDVRLRNNALWTESTNRAQRGVEVERAQR